MNKAQQYMHRAIELAKLGKGVVSPNPLVGCVIVYEGKIIGEGWHKKVGGPHAEVEAINSVEDKSLLPKTELYVTLEPCNHFGKTPPCTNLILEHSIKKVFVGSIDPNPLVGGKGIERLKSTGVALNSGILEEECLSLNKRFFTFHKGKRPYVILKWAETNDGFVARENYDSKWISSEASRQLVHKWRSEEDSILVGYHTAYYDNPSLTVRDYEGSNPIRVVLDKLGTLPKSHHVFNGEVETIIYSKEKESHSTNVAYAKLKDFSIQTILKDLKERSIQSIFVEGGAQTLNAFINENLWDEIRVFKSNSEFGSGIKAPDFLGSLAFEDNVGTDKLFVFKPRS